MSKSLSPAERRYSQVEKEALTIVCSIEHLHIYLYGAHFTLHTDCKPVEFTFSNEKSKPPARIERWNLRLQEYDFSTMHTKGTDNPSDFLSRHPSPDVANKQELAAEEYVNFLSTCAVPKAMSLREIQQMTKVDRTLQKLVILIQTGNWSQITEADGVDVAEFSHIRDELTVNEDSNIILRGSHILMPSSLRQQAMSIAHEGHQGLVKTKQLLREKMWFPGINEAFKRLIENCVTCQANGPENRPDPLQMSPLPPKPWHTLQIFVVPSRLERTI